MKRINWVSVDIPVCQLLFRQTNEFGTCNAPEGASCFNTLATCTSLPDYDTGSTRAFFIESTGDLDAPVGAIYGGAIPLPNIERVSMTPSRLSLGEGMGARATLRVTFADHPTTDLMPYEDLYHSTRGYDPWKRGTFWGKFLARHKYLRGQLVRWAVVDPEQLGFDEFPDDHQVFVIDRFDGPDSNGKVTMVCKDPVSLIDDKRSIAPALSRGFLASGITNSQTSATLEPAGIGNQEYPASGFINIGGKEICSFTRAGDALTIVRGQYNTTAIAHAEDDRVQVCVEYVGQDPADILYDLFTTYGRMPTSYIPLVDWQEQTGEYVSRLYSALIAEPVPVKDLVEELMQQAGITIWWDGRKLRLQVLRDIPSSQTYDDEKFLPGTVTKHEQPEKRISQVWVYFGQINPLEDLEDAKNYAVCSVTAQATAADLELPYNNVPSVKQIYSRWITRFNRPAANRVNTLLLRRYSEPPRMIEFSLLRQGFTIPPEMAQGVTIETAQAQDATGLGAPIKAQVIELRSTAGSLSVAAEEIVYKQIEDPDDPTIKIITIDTNEVNFNLRNTYLQIFPEPSDGDEIICIVQSGVIVGSTSVNTPAFDVGTGWPAGTYSIKLVVQAGAFVVGRAGIGGDALYQPTGNNVRRQDIMVTSPGGAGGVAFRTTVDTDIENEGTIGGGGGGSGGVIRIDVRDIGPQVLTSFSVAGGSAGAGASGSTGGTPSFVNKLINPNARNNIFGTRGAGRPTNNVTTPGSANSVSSSYPTVAGMNNNATAGSGGTIGVAGSAGSYNAFTNANDAGSIGSPGSPGNAIDGVSLCTITGGGQILGPTVN